MTLKRFLIIISFIIGSVSAGAQVFPVQVSTQLMPPFTPYLSDYTAPGAQKFMVQIRVIDPTLTDYTCKLRITIEGVNVTIRTKQTFVSQPITLEGGGTPQIFYGEDLIEYFNPNALDFSGFSRSQYEQGAKLKEGVYRFSVEVLDYNRSTVVSNKGGAVAWIILNDPPILNLPRNNSRTTIIDPTYIPFTWTPRHTGSPNASFTTEYKFRMVEVWPITRNPYDAFLSQPTLYETTTNLTQIVYGISEPALLPGRKYAWQVQAVDADGRDLFKNEGKSEVFVFQYGEALGLPDGLYLQNAGPSILNIRWEAPTGGLDPTGYRIQYRPHNNRKTDKWYELTATDLSKTIDKLQPETEYEVQLRSELNSQFSNYASPQVFKTSAATTGEFACSSNVQPPPLPTNSTPAPKLKPGDVIKAAGYDVHVRKVTSNGSTYTGEGGAEIPYLMGAKVSVTFKDISVNEQFWLTAGEIKTVWNANSIFLQTFEKKVESENASSVGDTKVTMAEADELVVIEGTIIATVTKNSDGDIVVYTTNGQEKVLPKGKSYAIVDAARNGYVVDEKGNIAKTTATEAQEALARGNRTYATNALHFEKGAGKYGYDKKKYDALAQYYQQLDGGQYVDWKSVPSSNTDGVDAVIDGGNYDPKNVRFELNSTPVTPSATIGKKFSLNVQGKVDGSVEELLAMYKAPGSENEEVLGKLNVASYDEVHGNLVIVPVNKTEFPIDKDVLATKLTEIYKQAIADWRVSLAAPITVTLGEKFNDGESGALTNYTDDMKKVINAYGKIQDNTYYIFLVTNSKSGTTLGYMPRSKQAGFVFVDKLNSNTIVNTIAHELGHGAFNLQHTFKEFPGLAEGSTDNLMDYTSNTGNALHKYQWDYVHDPQRVIGLFEDDADGALNLTTSEEYEWILEIYSPYYSNLFVNASAISDKKQKANTALKVYFNQEQVKSLSALYENLPRKSDGSIPVATLRKGLNPVKKGLYVFYTKRTGTSVIVTDEPLYFSTDLPVDINLYTGEFDTKGSSSNSNKETIRTKFNNKIDEYNELLYDFVWKTTTETSLTATAQNWFTEFWDYPEVGKDSEKKIEKLLGQLVEHPSGETFKMTSKQKIMYTYECSLDRFKFPIAVYVPEDNPEFKKLDLVKFQSNDDKPYSIFSFAVGKDITKSKLLLQVAKKDSDALKNFFITLSEDIQEILKSNVLTASEIKGVRNLIDQIADEGERSRFYLKLQEKVPYHNQRDNDQTADIADRMCNLSSLSACFEMLGISNPNTALQFEDYLEKRRSDNNYDARTSGKSWEKLAEDMGLSSQYLELWSTDEDFLRETLLPHLQKGEGVMLSISTNAGHIVRLQGITIDGLVVDDPYGKLTDFAAREAGTGSDYDTNDRVSGSSKGNNNIWSWDELKKITLKYAYVFKP